MWKTIFYIFLGTVGLSGDLVETVYGIGYRLKPNVADAKDLTSRADNQTLPASIVEPTQQQTLASVNQIWHRFKARISEQVGVLERAAIAVEQESLNQDLRQQARQEAHALSGSLGTFGLPEGSRLAQKIERLFQVEQPLSQASAVNLQEWVRLLRQQIEPSLHTSTEAVPSSASADGDRPLLLIVDRDRRLANQLIAEAATWGFRAEAIASLTRARDKILLEPPDIVLLDPVISTTAEASLSLLVDLSKQVPPIPVVILTEHDDLTQRLKAAQLGGRTFLPKPASAAQVLEAVSQVLHQADQAKGRVLVVDDDPVQLAIVRSLLEPWGLKITTLSHSQQFWETLEACSPDLLILDIEMPKIGGIELCQIVRNDSRWSVLPILFLTIHADADTMNRVFSVGADDFVAKPIVGSELVTRVINRLERVRLLRHLEKASSSPSRNTMNGL